jgi:Bacterial membrane protein YfhO
LSLNPALPLLALLGGLGTAGLAALSGTRREAALVWGVLAFAATALLAPALTLPTGIPSPAATLAAEPPWLGTGDPAAGNPLLRDVTYQVQPWQLFTRRELRAGRLPLWNPHQFAGAPFWSNGQSAPLFPLHLLFAALPLQLGFVLLPWLRLMAGGCGAWLLARELGLSRPGALLAALIFPLSGMLASFLLFPMGNALALVPWVLWSVERIAAGAPKGWAALAVAGGLQLLAGHPETAAHTALLSGIWLLVRGAARPLAAWLRLAGGWLAAAGLAAVQIVPLALALPETSRWQSEGSGGEPSFSLLLEQPLRLVLPQMYGHPAAGTWWGPFNYSATAVYAGALALPLAAAGLARCRGDRRWRAVAAVLAFSFLAAYHWPGLRDVLAALPVLGRAAHHRLIFGVELGLALLAGAGCDRWLEGKGRGLLAGAGLVGVALAAAWWLFAGEWARRGLTAGELAWTAGALSAALLLALSLRWSRERRWAVWPLLPAVVLCDLLAAHGGINRALPLERLYPETGAVRFLRGADGGEGREERVAGLGEALRPNAALVYGLYDPRGDDPVKLERYEAVYRTFAPGDPVYFQPIQRWGEPWLDRLGVRWVVAGPAEPPPDPRWRLAYAGTEGRVYERPGALPLVRWEGGSETEARVVERVPGRWEIAWRTATPARLVVAETWDRGWSAREVGEPVSKSAPLQPHPPGPPLPSPSLPPGEGGKASQMLQQRTGGGAPLPVAGGAMGEGTRVRSPGGDFRDTLVQGNALGSGGRGPVLPADGAFLGVDLGPGAGRIELRYRPPGLVAGAALSGLAFAILLGAAVHRPRTAHA